MENGDLQRLIPWYSESSISAGFQTIQKIKRLYEKVKCFVSRKPNIPYVQLVNEEETSGERKNRYQNQIPYEILIDRK
jgi:protein tyrosine phosphatase